MKKQLAFIIGIMCLANVTLAQTIPDLAENPMLDPVDADSLSNIPALDTLRPVYHSEKEGFTIDPSSDTGVKVYGCEGDFNNDGRTDYALILRGESGQEDRLGVLISGIDSVFILNQFSTLNEISEKYPYSGSLRPPRCYRQSESGVFEGLYDAIHEMPGDLIQYGWYSYVWNPKENNFTEILTSD